MKDFFKKIVTSVFTNKTKIIIPFVLIVFSFFVAGNAQAEGILSWMTDGVIMAGLKLIGLVIAAFIYVVGILLILVIKVLVSAASYNSFIYAPIVVHGWVIIRELCNMFFILLLLISAFGIILHQNNYGKGLLKNIIYAAILINFSKFICGFFIDIAQVITLTFVAGFKDIAGGNFVQMLGITEILKMDASKLSDTGVNLFTIVGSYILALLFSVVTLVVLVAMTAMFVIRIVTIWIYVIFSPIAFFSKAVPGKGGYFNDWSGTLTKEITVAPILAFFIWLSLATLGVYKNGNDFTNAYRFPGLALSEQDKTALGQTSGKSVELGVTQAGSAEHLMRLAISLAILMAGLKMAAKTGSFSSMAIKKADGYISRGKGWMQKKTWQGAKYAGGKAVSVGAGADAAARVSLLQAVQKRNPDFTFDPNKPGFATSLVTGTKNAFSKETIKSKWNSGVGNNKRDLAFKATRAGGNDFEHNGKTYQRKGDKFVNKHDDKDVLKSGNEEIKPMTNARFAYEKNRRSTSFETARSIEQAKVPKAIADEQKKMDGLSENELRDKIDSTNDTNKKKAAYMQLQKVSKKGLGEKDIKGATELMKDDNPAMLKSFIEEDRKKGGEHTFANIVEKDNYKSMTDSIKANVFNADKADFGRMSDEQVSKIVRAVEEGKGMKGLEDLFRKVADEGDKKKMDKLEAGIALLLNEKSKEKRTAYEDPANGISHDTALINEKLKEDRTSKSSLAMRKARVKLGASLEEASSYEEEQDGFDANGRAIKIKVKIQDDDVMAGIIQSMKAAELALREVEEIEKHKAIFANNVKKETIKAVYNIEPIVGTALGQAAKDSGKNVNGLEQYMNLV